MKNKRKIITIDEEKCDGCGLCVSACAEGALQIIDGKARLVSETYCDGLGACIGDCPQGAITLTEREADAFDEKAVAAHLAKPAAALPCGCPGSTVQTIAPLGIQEAPSKAAPSRLTNWPVQLMLVPTNAPYLRDADLAIAADCVPCACGDFHERFVKGRVLIIACPKLDDSAYYVEKLTEMFQSNPIRSLVIPFMEVPCCSGLVRIVQAALQNSGKTLPVRFVKIAANGRILDDIQMP